MAAKKDFDPKRVRALLLDLDGVVFLGDHPVPGAVRAVRRLRAAGTPLRFVSNTTATPRADLLAKLERLGVPVASRELFTPAALARRRMEREAGRNGVPLYRLVGAPALVTDLGPGMLPPDAEGQPDWVVVGLHPPSFTHEVLSRALNDLLGGARLLALHANRMWATPRGIELGLGAYVRALAYGARVEPIVVGKPAAAFFHEALRDLDVPPSAAAMVGDDVEADVGGAQAAGLAGIAVRTGKFREDTLARSGVTPDAIVADAAALADLLGA